MGAFCIVKNSSTENFINKVGEKQAAVIAEMVNREEPIYIRNSKDKLVKSKVFESLLNKNNNDFTATFDEYIDLFNNPLTKYDDDNQPIIESLAEVTDSYTINDNHYTSTMRVLNNYQLRLIKFPFNKPLKDTINRGKSINFEDFTNYDKSRAFNIIYDNEKTTVDELEKLYYGENGYSKEGALDNIIGDEKAEVQFKTILNQSLSFFKGFATIRNIELENIDNPTESERELINAITRLKSLSTNIDNLKATFNRLLRLYFDKVLTRLSTNPEILLKYRSIFDMQDDETKVQLLLDAIADTHHRFLANLIKKDQLERGKLELNIERLQKQYDKKLKELEAKGITFDDILEKDKDGNITGRLISEFNNDYIDIHKSYYSQLKDAEQNYGKYSPQYAKIEKEYNQWKLDNILHKQSDEVIKDRIKINDILFSNPIARKALEEINDKINTVLNAYDKSFSIFDLSDNDIRLLVDFNREKQLLSNSYNKDGIKKTGEELDLAITLQQYNKALSEHTEKYYETVNNPSFETKLAEHKSKDTPESKGWLKRNTKKLLKQNFWENLTANNTIINGEKIENEDKDILKPYKDEEGNVIGNVVPDAIRAKILEEHKNRFKSVEIKEDRIPKGISRIKNNNVYTDEYYAKFDNIGHTSLEDNNFIKNSTTAIKDILQKYVNTDGIVDYSAISLDDLKLINAEFDIIDYVSMKYVSDKDRIDFMDWMSNNHDFIIDEESFNKADNIARSRGVEYYNAWLYANTHFAYTDLFHSKVEELRNEYNIKEAGKSKGTIINLNFKLLRRRYSAATSYTQLPTSVKAAIRDKAKVSHYTLKDKIDVRRITSKDNTSTDKDLIVKIQDNIKKSYKLNYDAELTKTKNHYMRYREAYNDLFNKTTTPEYFELLKEHGTDSEWYYENHTINEQGEIEPVAYWVDSIPKEELHYNENTPKSKIWGYSKVNNENYIDKNKTVARTWINDNVVYQTTEYYEKESLLHKGDNKWFNENHVYNPITNKYEPISIWTSITSNTEELIDNYAPKKHLTTIKIKDEFSNESEVNNNLTDPYRDVFGYALPKKGSSFHNKDFDKIKDNELYTYIKDLLNTLTEHYGKETLIDAGWLPLMKDKKKESNDINKILKTIGWYSYANSDVVGENNEAIKVFNMPFVEKFIKEDLLNPPVKEQYLTEIEFTNAYNDIANKNKEIKAKNEEYNQAIIDKDYKKVLRLFISAAMEHKFLVEHENELKLGVEELRQLSYFKRKNLLSRSRKRITNTDEQDLVDTLEEFEKQSGEGSNTVKHLESYIKMIHYKDFEKDEGNFTKIARVLQSFSSIKGMGFNAPGAFNNVAYGKVQIAIERFSGYYFDNSDRLKAEKDYWGSVFNYFADTGKSQASSLTSAIVKKFHIVEMQDEQPLTNNSELNKAIKDHLISTNTLFILHHIGEHYMQNVALLSMLYSNRVINGKIQSFTEYTYDLMYKAIISSLGINGKATLDSFIETNKNKDKYLDGKSDMLRDFILNSDTGIQKEFLNTLDEYKKQAKEEFNNYPTLHQSFEFIDGEATFKEDSNITDEEYLLFRKKVLKVNQKMQGIYNKLDAGTVQHGAIGRLAMQFRKWMRPGWNRRFGSRFGRTSWNEARNEYDSGSYISFFRFVTKPIFDNLSRDTFKENPDLTVQTAIGNIFKDYSTYLKNMSLYWNTLNDTEKANIKRTMVEMTYFLGAVIMFGLLKKLGDDDDELQDTKGYAYSMYALDRLKSEIRAYDPMFGWFNESRKLMKDPFAAMGAVDDMLKLFYTIIFEGDEEYKAGMYHGISKTKVQLMKNIPLYNRVLRYNSIEAYAGYYKLYGY